MQRSEVWWASLPDPIGSSPGYRRPVVIVQADSFNQSRINTVIAVVLTSNLRLAAAPGNVRLSARSLGAEKVIAAEKEGRKIAVEIKSFLGTSLISEFHPALGQLMNYRLALEAEEPDRELYLAVPGGVYDAFFTLQFGQAAIRRYQLKLIVYDVDVEEIIQWHE